MAATDMRKAGLEIGAIVEVLDPDEIRSSSFSAAEEARLRDLRARGSYVVLSMPSTFQVEIGLGDYRTIVHVEDVTRSYADAQKTRQARFEKLSEHYPGEAGVPEESDTIERFCLVQKNTHHEDGSHAFQWGDTFEACTTETDAGGEILDGWFPEAVFDLDTGDRIEVHVSSPVITRSEDQGAMVNVLDEKEAKLEALRMRGICSRCEARTYRGEECVCPDGGDAEDVRDEFEALQREMQR